MAIESVLLMTILLGAFLALTNSIKQKQLVSKFVAKPMQGVATMTGYGTWKSCPSPAKCHPNSISRAVSSDPDPVP